MSYPRLIMKFLRISQGETLRHGSTETRIPDSRLGQIERGLVEPTDAERKAIARWLGRPEAVIFAGPTEVAAAAGRLDARQQLEAAAAILLSGRDQYRTDVRAK